jgi:hypothetical protein
MADIKSKKAEVAILVAYAGIMIAYGILLFHKLPTKK